MQDRNKKTAIGLDIGTTTICGVLTDICTGEMIKKITLANDTFIEGKEDFEKLQDAAKIEEKCLGIIEELSNGADDLACIGVTGQMHGIVYVDREGNGVSPVIIWQDGRGNCPYPGQPDKSYAEVLSQRSGYRLATGFGVVTHYYNWVNHLIPEMAVTFCTIPDYIAMGLAGLRKPVLHGSMAASLGLFSMEQGMFDHEAIENLGMDYSFFPEVLKEEASIGMWKGMAKIGPAFGDNQASFLGSVDGKSNVLVNVGTGSQVYQGLHVSSACQPGVGGVFQKLCGPHRQADHAGPYRCKSVQGSGSVFLCHHRRNRSGRGHGLLPLGGSHFKAHFRVYPSHSAPGLDPPFHIVVRAGRYWKIFYHLFGVLLLYYRKYL